uniref:Ig-like domain-containing protein n=1 Tax=Anopheles dirus TaxID=7168 RepID=A0A182NQQ3_9DIPT
MERKRNGAESKLLNIISGEVQSYWEQPFAQPYFDNSTKREVTATVGQSALLHCRVRNLGDRAVSWIRKRDLHILTVGILTYTNDQRFQSLHTEGSDEWTLRITSPQPRDSGTYECQVSTEPKISQAFRLNVVGKYSPSSQTGAPRVIFYLNATKNSSMCTCAHWRVGHGAGQEKGHRFHFINLPLTTGTRPATATTAGHYTRRYHGGWSAENRPDFDPGGPH